MHPRATKRIAPDASVIVVTHNNESLIADCLRAIEEGTATCRCEVIVVDSGSTDRTVEVVRQHPSRPRLLLMAENVGFAASNNEGIQASAASLIVLVNSDAFPDPGSIDRLIRTIDEMPDAGIVGGRLRDPGGALQPSVGRFPSLFGGIWVALFLHRLPLASRFDIGVNAHPAHYSSRRRVDWVTAAFCVVRRDIGPMPADRFMYGEDVAWAWECRNRGFQVWLEPTATAVHIGRASVDQSQEPGFAQRRRAEFELAWFARRGRLAELVARVVLVTHALLRLAVYLILVTVHPRDMRRIREYWALLDAALSPESAAR